MLQLNIWRLKMALWFLRCCYVISDNTLRAIRFPARLPMVVTVPALFAATWFGFDPAVALYARFTKPPPVALYEPPPLQAPATRPRTGPPLTPGQPLVIVRPVAREPSRKHPRHTDRTDVSRLLKQPDPTQGRFFPTTPYPDPDAPTTGGLY